MHTVDEVIEVDAPVGEVWSRWAEVERLPEFMEGIEEVRRIDDDHLRWRGSLEGEPVEWTSRITAWEPERALAWSSEDGREAAGGRVELTETAAGRTRVHVTIDWPSTDMVEVSLETLRGLGEG